MTDIRTKKVHSREQNRRRGREGEAYARSYLEEQGCIVQAQNWHAGRSAELDFIVNDGDTLAFVEVKYRRSVRGSGGLEAVGYTKQSRIATAARYWCKTRGISVEKTRIRFDIVSILHLPNREPEIRWVRAAFRPGSR